MNFISTLLINRLSNTFQQQVSYGRRRRAVDVINEAGCIVCWNSTAKWLVLIHGTDKQFSHIPERELERKGLAKRFDDAIKGTVARMLADPVDLLPYFRDVEQQFDLLEVPADLKV